jgi:hypothetical protein
MKCDRNLNETTVSARSSLGGQYFSPSVIGNDFTGGL